MRLVRQRNSIAPIDMLFVDVDLSDLLGKRLIQQGRVVSACQPAEFLDHATGAARLRAAGCHLLDMDRQYVPLDGALDHDRPALGIQPRHLEYIGRHVAFARDLAREGVERFHYHAITRIDMQNRVGIGADGVVEGTLLLLGQFMGDT